MLDQLANKTIVLVTEAIYGLGDFLAAKKLMLQIRDASPTTRVYWYVYSPQDIKKHLDAAKTEFSNNLDVRLLHTDDVIDLSNCKSCDLILLFPTVHYLKFADYQELKRYKAPVLHIYEYDGVPEFHNLQFKSELVPISTGFNGLGINLEDLQQRTLPTPEFYDENRITLFSYLNLASNYCVNQSTLTNYLHIAFNTIDTNKSVDLITNSSLANKDTAFYDHIWSQGFAKIIVLSKDSDGAFKQEVRNSLRSDAGTKELRIIQSFPLSNNELLGALAVAHPLVQVTGDQTLSELMSFASIKKDIFPFYQIMSWKNALHEHWVDYATACLGKESHYVVLLKKLSKDNKLDVIEFSDYWRTHQDAILKDSRSLYTGLKEEKDLTRNGVVFLDHVFYIKNHFPETEFGDYCRLAAQLTTKIDDSKTLQKFLCELPHIQQSHRQDNLSALTEFLTLNSTPIRPEVLKQVSEKLLTLQSQDQVHAARNLRLMLAKLPAHQREQWIIPMFSELLKVSPFTYQYILEKVEAINDFSGIDANKNWFGNLIEQSKTIDNSIRTIIPKNAILLAVDVLTDGVGDLAKFIGMYHLLQTQLPTTKINCLIHCRHSNRQIVLTMLKENNIPLKDSFICSFSEIEYTGYVLAKKDVSLLLRVKYRNLDCDGYLDNQALYISVATPFPAINSKLRAGLYKAPYLEIAEVQFVSYIHDYRINTSDSRHHLVTMGLDKASVGIEITKLVDKTAKDIIKSLSPTVNQQLLDGNDLNQFTQDTFFMPAYVKNDRGILSLFYFLTLSEKAYPEQQTAVIWLHTLPCELEEPRLQARIKQAGFSEIVFFDDAGQRKQISIVDPIGTRQLRIMTGRVAYMDFDLLFHLASKMGGVAGCTGQNSFEKAVSFELIPAFSAPGWQIPIISQTRSVVATLFTSDSQNHLILNDYLNMLQNISNYLNIINVLEKNSTTKHIMQTIKNLDYSEFLKEITAHAKEHGYKLPPLSDTDPVILIEQFFSKYPLEDLKSSWALLCKHIKQHKNLNTWLVNKVQELMPDPESLRPIKEDRMSKLSEEMKELCSSNAHIDITPETLPQTTQLLHQLLHEIGYDPKANSFRFILADSKSLFIQNVGGLFEPTIAIGMQSWSKLTIPEIRFALRLCFSMSYLYPMESTNLRLRDVNHQEILKHVKGDLDVGINYCRKLLELVKAEKDLYSKEDPKPKRYRDLENTEAFYQNLIKEIEIPLAQKNKHELQSSFIKSQDRAIDAKALEELQGLEASWKAAVAIPNQNLSTVEQLKYLLSCVPNLRIKELNEFLYPNKDAMNYLKMFDAVHIDTSDAEEARLALSIIDSAYANCVPIFTKLYLSACNKLFEGNLVAMGPFRKLLKLLQLFMRATTEESATNTAKQILDFFVNPAYKGLFHSSTLSEEYFIHSELNPKKPDAMMSSSIGFKIKWTECLGSDYSENNFTQLRTLAIKSGSTDIAKVLFCLGDIGYKPLWDLLSAADIEPYGPKKRTFINLGEVPEIYSASYGHRGDINQTFTDDFLRYKYFEREIQPCNSPLSISAIESFIDTHKNMLSLSNIEDKACSDLTDLFDAFLLENQEIAQPFISRFFCDPSYASGIYELRRWANTIGFYDSTQFKGCTPNSDMHPFLLFINKHCPDYIPMNDLFECIHANFTIRSWAWPLDYYFKRLDLSINKLEDVDKAIKIFNSQTSLLSSSDIKLFYEYAIGNSYTYAAKHVPDIQIFSKKFSDFLAYANENRRGKEVCELLWQRTDFASQIMNPETKIAIGAVDIATIYQILDQNISWPNSTIRDRFSEIVLKAIREETDDKESGQASTKLLFSRAPLTDMLCIKELIKLWVAVQARNSGLDDNSDAYFKRLVDLIVFIEAHCPNLYRKDLLESLCVALVAQDKLCELVDKQLNASKKNQLIMNSEVSLVNCAKAFANENLSLDVVAFLSYELTQNSLNTFVSKLNNKGREALAKLRIGGAGDDEKAKMSATFFYHNFWGLNIDERAVIINNLLIPSTRVTTDTDANTAFQEALDYIIKQLFAEQNNEESSLSIALLKSYLQTSHQDVKPYLLAAILTANRLKEGNQISIASTLPKLAEALGAAGVKAGQAAHSFPNTPEHIREGLAYLKSQARIPYRWELWKLLKAAIPKDLLNEIAKMQQLLGGASFYLAVEVLMKNGDVRVIRLLREHATIEATTGFKHMNAALLDCKHQDIHKITQDLETIIDQAEKGALVEIDHTCAKRQYKLAEIIYNKAPQTVKSNGVTYHIKIIPVTLDSVGKGYQLISKAEGIEFNTLKKQSEQKALCEVVATAIYKMELELMLSGKPCDFDRHGAQCRITSKPVRSNEYEVTVVNYDFGEIAPEPPTAMQLFHCQKLINELSSTLFSSTNLLRFMSQSQDTSVLSAQLSKQMLAYIRKQELQGCNKDDLSRLRGIFKGMLALNDYFEQIPKTRTFLLELNTLFNKYSQSSSMVSNALSIFASASSRTNSGPSTSERSRRL